MLLEKNLSLSFQWLRNIDSCCHQFVKTTTFIDSTKTVDKIYFTIFKTYCFLYVHISPEKAVSCRNFLAIFNNELNLTIKNVIKQNNKKNNLIKRK